jgi:hypothetical protein
VINTVATCHCSACESERTWLCGFCDRRNNGAEAAAGSGRSERRCVHCPGVTERNPQAELMREGQHRVAARLKALGGTKVAQLGDGNCQFRALASQLFGDAAGHLLVRAAVVEFMGGEGRSAFEGLIDDAASFEEYLKKMATADTWGGDETMKAAALAFGVHVHCVTSCDQRWNKHYQPDPFDRRHAKATSASGDNSGSESQPAAAEPDSGLHIFLVYLEDERHYDDVRMPPLEHAEPDA